MENTDVFWAMGGFGAYVWPAYGLAAVVLLGMLARSFQRVRQAKNALKRLPY